eukprot:1154615-Pelagomonas_calceolata.AAC.7
MPVPASVPTCQKHACHSELQSKDCVAQMHFKLQCKHFQHQLRTRGHIGVGMRESPPPEEEKSGS